MGSCPVHRPAVAGSSPAGDGTAPYHQRNDHEVDLYVETGRAPRCVHVVWSLGEPDALRRETEALTFGKTTYPKSQAVVVCHEMPSTRVRGLPVVPAWRYLLGVERGRPAGQSVSK